MDALHTPLCDLLGCRYPIIQAPMAGGWTTPDLVAAVCNAGGFGMLPAAQIGAEALRAAIRATKARTDRPFGVNFQVAAFEAGSRDTVAAQGFLDRFREELNLPPGATALAPPPLPIPEQLAIVAEERVPVVSFAVGDPGELVARARAGGARVLVTATTVAEAERGVALGADAIIAQGAEAGGHRSTFALGPAGEVPLVGTIALVPQIVDAVAVPVVATGGIGDGRGLVAALALGAGGAQLGTRFLVARESAAPPAYRQRLLAATEADTIVTTAFTGRPARSVRNRFAATYQEAGAAPLAWPFQRAAAGDIYAAARERGDADLFPLLAGQGLRLLKDGQGAGEIVAEIVEEARGLLARLGRLAG